MSHPGDARSVGIVVLLATASGSLYALLSFAGDLRDRPASFLAAYAALVALMLLAWRRLRASPKAAPVVIGAALAFRLIAAAGAPLLSDDVYRYVWDGRVQLYGIHPYVHAPADPSLAGLRDENWSRINHPELKTIYPPLAQIFFLALASVGAGPLGFKLALGLVDFGVVLMIHALLRQLGLPRDRSILYAWNPLAVIEAAGSGHVEPLGVLLALLAASCIVRGRRGLSTLALAASVHVKLLPAVLIPGYAKHYSGWPAVLLALALLALLAPYALGGPPLGEGLLVYASTWEHNAFLYAGVERLMEWMDVGTPLKRTVAALQERFDAAWVPWDVLYRNVWPRNVARIVVGLLAVAWLVWLATRGIELTRQSLLAVGGILLLSPTIQPWYLLWLLPWAALELSWGWLLLCMLVPLSYAAGRMDVPVYLRLLEFAPPLAVMLAARMRRSGPSLVW